MGRNIGLKLIVPFNSRGSKQRRLLPAHP
jgi:hypothetical protein